LRPAPKTEKPTSPVLIASPHPSKDLAVEELHVPAFLIPQLLVGHWTPSSHKPGHPQNQRFLPCPLEALKTNFVTEIPKAPEDSRRNNVMA
jgi:hypothetical protein